MSASFTPGPWHVERGECIVSKGRSLAAVWPASLLGGDLPQEANAKLIAAAPSLHAALERIANMTDVEADFDGFEARRIAQDALAQLGTQLPSEQVAK